MLNGKLRIAPTCYHVLHLFPVVSAHEMGFFYDAGPKSDDGGPGYEILRQAMVPFGLEKLDISQAMKEQSVDIALDVQRLRYASADPEERKIKISSAAPVDLEAMPFPIDGLATGFEDMLAEEEKLGELNYEVPPIKDVCAQDLVAQAYKELMEQEDSKSGATNNEATLTDSRRRKRRQEVEAKTFRNSIFLALAFFLTLAVSLQPAGAQSGDSPFKGQTITIIAGSSPGGGTDSLARLLSRHFSKHIPGNPKIIVSNVAGAAGLIAANNLYNRAPKDGTAIGTMATGLTFRTALKDSAIKFELEKFTYLGQIASEGNFVYLRSETPFTSVEAIKKANKEGKKPKFGAQAKEHNSNVVPMAMEAILGIDVEVVYGYPGTAEILLDIERGALDGRAQSRGSLFATRSNWLEKNFIKVLAVTSPQRDSRLPNVPTLEEISPADKKPLLEAMYSVQGRTFAMPPGVPADRAKILRDAFAAMFKDKDFQQDVDKLGWNDELIRGEDLNKKVDALIHNESAMGFFRKILQ